MIFHKKGNTVCALTFFSQIMLVKRMSPITWAAIVVFAILLYVVANHSEWIFGVRMRYKSQLLYLLTGNTEGKDEIEHRPEFLHSTLIQQHGSERVARIFDSTDGGMYGTAQVSGLLHSGLGNRMFTIATTIGFAQQNKLMTYHDPVFYYDSLTPNIRYCEYGGHLGDSTINQQCPHVFRFRDVFPNVHVSNVSRTGDIEKEAKRAIRGYVSRGKVFNRTMCVLHQAATDYEIPLTMDDVLERAHNGPGMIDQVMFVGSWFSPMQFITNENTVRYLRAKTFQFHDSVKQHIALAYDTKVLFESQTSGLVHLRLGHATDTFGMPYPLHDEISRFVENEKLETLMVICDNIVLANPIIDDVLAVHPSLSIVWIHGCMICEMYCMTQAPSLLLSRSTYSWWGAFLNQKASDNGRIYVCPQRWPTNRGATCCFDDMIERQKVWKNI